MIETLRIIWKYLAEYKKDVYYISILYIITSGLELASPYIFGNVVNSILKNVAESRVVDNEYILRSIYAVLFLIALIIWLRRYLDIRRSKIAGRCERKMALAINKHILWLPKIFHDNKKNGDILETISMARWNMNTIVSQAIFVTLPEIITAILISAASLFISPVLTITIFAIVVSLAYASQIKSAELLDIEENYMRVRGKAAAYTEDAIRNIDTIKSFAIEPEVQENYEQKYNDIDKVHDESIGLAVNVNAVQLLIIGMGLPVIFAVSSYLLARGSINAGTFVTVLLFAGLVLKPFRTVAENYYTIKRGMVSIKEANKLLINEKAESFETGIIPDKKIKGGIEFKNIWFAYKKGEKPVLRGLNLKILPGEKVAIVGPNGCGKSTLLALAQGFYNPDQGEIFIDGSLNIKELNISFLRRCFAEVPQKIRLFNLSILDNIRIVNPDIVLSDEEVIRIARLAQMGFVCDYVDGFHHVITERENLSPGQTQRIALARIIPAKAPIVFLDEPTSAQDRCSEEEISKLLNGPFKDKTVIIISHRPEPLKFVDRVIEIKNGQANEITNFREISK